MARFDPSVPEPLRWVVQCATAGCPRWGRTWELTLVDLGEGLVAVPGLRCWWCGGEPVTLIPPRWEWTIRG